MCSQKPKPEQKWNNASSFNDMSLTFSKLTYNDIKDFPARVRVTYHTRNEHTGDCGK